MPIMKWSNDLSVNVNEIDDQHKKLIDLINNLHDAMLARKGKEALGQTLDELAAYTVYHFSAEEKYMKQFNYSGYIDHKKEHEAFVNKVDNVSKEYQQGKLGISMELMNFLRDWVQNHIKISDKKYESNFHEHGLN
jgi:hemerythrin